MPPRSTTRDVLVVGGGIVGLAVAERLTRAGMSVVLLERGRCGEGATSAAGGMLAPLGESRAPGPFLQLAMESLALYPELVRRVEEATGHDVGFRVCGKLLVARTDTERARLAARSAWQRDEGFAVRLLDGAEARALEPGLAGDVIAAAHLATDALIDNRRLASALTAAARAAGAEVREGTPVRALVREGGRLAGVELEDGSRRAAPTVVLAAGAWSGGIAGLPRPLPVRPIRGQMLALSTAAPPNGIVASAEAYLIPRRTPGADLVVIGATQEDVGFREGTDPPAIERLRRGAERVLPALAGAPEAARWSGFRPGTPDELPFLGRDPEVEGLVHASGHFRNGILLAPATAVRVERLLVEGDARGLEAFRPDRFRGAAGPDEGEPP